MKKIFLIVFFGLVSLANAQIHSQTITPNGSYYSASFKTEKNRIFDVLIPNSYDGTTIEVQVSTDNSTFYSYGNIDAQTIVKGKLISFKPSENFGNWEYCRFKSDSVATGADTLKYTLGIYFNK